MLRFKPATPHEFACCAAIADRLACSLACATQPVANFQTHLLGAVLTGAAMAFAAAGTGLLEAGELVAVAGVTVVGGLLPDIDSDHSRPVRMLCTTAAVMVVVMLWASGLVESGLAQLANSVDIQLHRHVTKLIALASYFILIGVTRASCWWVVRRTTTHRGVLHSLPAACALGLAATLCLAELFSNRPGLAWITGVALASGFVIHLVLDECASVDLSGRRLKRSFGTALKLGDRNNLVGTVGLYVLVFWLMREVPEPGTELADLVDPSRWRTTFAALCALIME